MKLNEIIRDKMFNLAIDFIAHELELATLPNIEFIDAPYITNGQKASFGVFDGDTIKIVINNRHIVDSIRTLSHELTHWKQQEMGYTMSGEDGSNTENAANSIAGIIMRRMGETHPEIFLP